MHFFSKSNRAKLNDAVDIKSLEFIVFFSVLFFRVYRINYKFHFEKKKMCNVNVDLLFSKCFYYNLRVSIAKLITASQNFYII